MRRLILGGTALLLGVAGVSEFAGCNGSFDICEGTACTGADSGDGDGQVIPKDCVLTDDPKDSPTCVDDTIGIFVSASGSDSNAGTKASPLKTIGAALGKTNSQHDRVYVCDGTYAESVKLTKANSVFGGFACADWSYSGTLPKVGPATSGYALDIENVTSAVTVEDLELDAPTAQNPGDSSIAVFIASSTNVTLKRVTAIAKDGAAGADAVPASNWDGGVAIGNDASTDLGADPCVNTCANGATSVGGAGGIGVVSGVSSGGGGDGGPSIPPNPVGADGVGGPGKLAGCNTGDQGAAATSADGGASGGTNAGSLGGSGWSVGVASAGAAGGVGQGGGGGGGGAHAGATNNGGGGSGGCGGCGGAGGAGGGSGGSSFAILVFQSTVSTDTCILQTGAGGAGKSGGTAQLGQTGGFPGNPAQSGIGCTGGTGGIGGAGAGGGGGAGGNAIAIGYVGTKPTVSGGTMTEGTAGTAGGGGTGAQDNDGKSGAAGVKADLQELP